MPALDLTPMTDKIRLRVSVDMNGCWNWVKAKNHAGYGIAYNNVDKKVQLAHRLSYAAFVGPIPDGLQLDHLCRNHQCVNPAHLEVVSSRENTRRGNGPSANNFRKTHCKHGHEFTAQNIYPHPTRGNRHCRKCMQRGRVGKRAILRPWLGKFGIDNPRSKAVVQVAIDGSIKSFSGISEAARITGLCFKNISACCLGKRKTHGGFQWRFNEVKNARPSRIAVGRDVRNG